jgi:hypothetical protein
LCHSLDLLEDAGHVSQAAASLPEISIVVGEFPSGALRGQSNPDAGLVVGLSKNTEKNISYFHMLNAICAIQPGERTRSDS